MSARECASRPARLALFTLATPEPPWSIGWWRADLAARWCCASRTPIRGATHSEAEDEHSRRSSLAGPWTGMKGQAGPGPSDRTGNQSARISMGRPRWSLLAAGAIYPCFCSPEDLDVQRQEARRAGETFRYPGTCRDLPAKGDRATGPGESRLPIRFRVPNHGVRFVDGITGGDGRLPRESWATSSW